MTNDENLNIQESRLLEMHCTILVDSGVCALPLDYSSKLFENGRCAKHCRVSLEDGSLCSLPCMPNGYCYRHGGQEAKSVQVNLEGGIAEARSKLLTTKQASIYEMALADQNVLSHRSDLALLEMRIEELMLELNEWKSEELLQAIQKELGRTSRQMKKSLDKIVGGKEMASGIEELRSLLMLPELRMLVNDSVRSYSTWAEIDKLVHRRKLTADAERKRLVSQQRLVTGERAMAVISRIQEALKTAVRKHADAKTARLIMTEFSEQVRKVVGF